MTDVGSRERVTTATISMLALRFFDNDKQHFITLTTNTTTRKWMMQTIEKITH